MRRARPEAYSRQLCLLYQLRYPTRGMVKIDFRWTVYLFGTFSLCKTRSLNTGGAEGTGVETACAGDTILSAHREENGYATLFKAGKGKGGEKEECTFFTGHLHYSTLYSRCVVVPYSLSQYQGFPGW